ncbi:putative alpha beta-hydrolase protein [Rosellinia necatrix]|uniref:Putative alpha beta-hydrolase protein n=1 Tax=Rosellinia necatrix TaxID=77044 RepID=A0A1S7UP64_ROSNE|nr:putative alpha beta-hydrolase protein [Rosellinia necatrix]
MIPVPLLFPLLALSCVGSRTPAPAPAPPPRCDDLFFTFTTTAANRVARDPPGDLFSDAAAIGAFLGQPVAYQEVSGTFTLYGQLCRPRGVAAGAGAAPKVQLLVHGSTYNHTYWSSLREPSDFLPGNDDDEDDDEEEKLSWVHAATRLGYWTLAIDRLGQGRSSTPDPVNVVQSPLQAHLLHLLVRRIRDDDVLGIGFSSSSSSSSSPSSPPTRRHSSDDDDNDDDRGSGSGGGGGGGGGKLIYVGHSFGSGLGVQLASAHPDDVDGLVLTGLAAVRGDPGPGSALARWGPAAAAFPGRFPAGLDAGYLASTNESGRAGLYWGAPGTFPPSLRHRDWAGQGTQPLGEALTVAEYLAGPPPSARFRRPVLVAAGARDAIFCSDLGSRDLGPAWCAAGDDGEVGRTRAWFPGVPGALFAAYLQPRAGHSHLLHKTGDRFIRHAHDWMASVGL